MVSEISHWVSSCQSCFCVRLQLPTAHLRWHSVASTCQTGTAASFSERLVTTTNGEEGWRGIEKRLDFGDSLPLYDKWVVDWIPNLMLSALIRKKKSICSWELSPFISWRSYTPKRRDCVQVCNKAGKRNISSWFIIYGIHLLEIMHMCVWAREPERERNWERQLFVKQTCLN